MSESSHNATLGSIFQLPRTALDQGRFAIEQGAELQRSAQRLTVDGVERIGPLQREGIDATRRTVVGFVDALAADRGAGPSEDLDELFRELEATHEDVFEHLEQALRESSESYEQSLDDVLEALDDAADAAENAADDVEDTTADAADEVAADAEAAVQEPLDEFADETERFRAALDREFDGLGETYGDRLLDGGFESLSDLAEATAEDVADVAAVTEERAQSWIDRADDLLTEREAAVRRLEDVDGIGDTYADRLQRAGIETEGQLAQTSAERVAEVAQVSEDRASEWVTRAQSQA